MQIIELDRRKTIAKVESGSSFSRQCRNVSELIAQLVRSGWKIVVHETEDQLRVDFLDFPNEHPHFITCQCKDKQTQFNKLRRKLESLVNFGGAA